MKFKSYLKIKFKSYLKIKFKIYLKIRSALQRLSADRLNFK